MAVGFALSYKSIIPLYMKTKGDKRKGDEGKLMEGSGK